jgi:hypothetical protein
MRLCSDIRLSQLWPQVVSYPPAVRMTAAARCTQSLETSSHNLTTHINKLACITVNTLHTSLGNKAVCYSTWRHILRQKIVLIEYLHQVGEVTCMKCNRVLIELNEAQVSVEELPPA